MTLSSGSSLASTLKGQGEYADAEIIYRRVLAGSEKLLGDEHPKIFVDTDNLALVLQIQCKYDDAEGLYRRVVVGCESAIKKEHPDHMTYCSNLASLLMDKG